MAKNPTGADREKLARDIYEKAPAQFEDRVDGMCTMGWRQAVDDKHPLVQKAYDEADSMIRMFEPG